MRTLCVKTAAEMFVCIILNPFPLALQLLTEKLLAELRVFNEAAEKEKEALQVRLTLFQSQTGSEHLVLERNFKAYFPPHAALVSR